MEQLFSKISAYQFLNYMLPGSIFVTLLNKWTAFQIDLSHVVEYIVVYYFVGMILSRIGSIVVECVYKKMRIVGYAKYEDYLIAIDKDKNKTIETLLKECNMFRTLVAACFVLAVLVLLGKWDWFMKFNEGTWSSIVYVGLLLLLFSLSYRKQVGYIRKKVFYFAEVPEEEEAKHMDYKCCHKKKKQK